ncbi:MAG: PEP-CTERM sorting domain-containing protein [Candidatus Sulfotelmatobacter sp.]
MALRPGFSLRTAANYALLVAIVALLAPIAARADTCLSNSTETCFTNTDGNASTHGSGSSTTFSLTGSTITGIGWKTYGNLGDLSFTTGDLMTGPASLKTNATFSDTGSTFTLAGGTYNGITGTIFTGAFSSTISWTLVGGACAGTVCTYDLSGQVVGTWYPNGPFAHVGGGTIQLYFKSNGPYTGGPIQDTGGVSYVLTPLVTPEPSTLGLMGTGFVGIGLLGRRKLKAKGGPPASQG